MGNFSPTVKKLQQELEEEEETLEWPPFSWVLSPKRK